MAKRRGVNKSQAIRDVLGEKGINTAPKEVMAILKEKSISVSAAQVSNVKAAMKSKKRKGGKGAKRGRKPGSGAGGAGRFEEALQSAAKLAELFGGVDAAKRALDLIAKIS